MNEIHATVPSKYPLTLYIAWYKQPNNSSTVVTVYDWKQESPAVAREDALQPIHFLLQYWPSRSSKVNDFHLICTGLCDFLLVSNSNLDYYLAPFSHNTSVTDDGQRMTANSLDLTL